MSVKIRQKNPGWLKHLMSRYRTRDVLAVGYPASETGSIAYPNGTPVVLVAAVNNFGSVANQIPARTFMTDSQEPAIEATQPIAETLIPLLNEGKITVPEILEKMGPFAEAAFKDTITNGGWAANAPSTVAAKDSAQPLIDTGLLRNSLTYVVRDKE